MKDKTLNLKKGQHIAFISVIITFCLAIMKGGVGFLFDSHVLIADAVHSTADLMTHTASGFGLWIAARGKTQKFPYGLYRAETFGCMLVGFFISMAGIELFREGIEKLFHLEAVSIFPVFPIGVSIISSVAGFIIAKMESKVGHDIGSQSLIASSKEAYLDVYTSLAVLLGILLAYFRIRYAEGSIIILLSLLLIKIGVENIWRALLVLLDANLDPGLQSEIEEKINGINGVKGVGNVKIRQSGPFKMIQCIISTRPSLSLYKAHGVADKVEKMIAENYEQIESIFIHVEPNKEKKLRVIIPIKENQGLESIVHGHFARAPHYLVLELNGPERAEVIGCYDNEFLNDREHIGVKTSRQVIEYNVDLLFTASIGEISYHILKSNMIDVYQAKASRSVKETLLGYHDNRLKLLSEPSHLIETSIYPTTLTLGMNTYSMKK